MIKNYYKDKHGVIVQKKRKPFNYDLEYINFSYNNYGELTNYISYLRLGYIIGSIKNIPKSILDVGYGNGSFVKCCKNIIKNVYGNDVNNYPLPEGIEFVENILSKHFDVITFFDSLEHFSDISFIGKLNCNYICVSVPDCHYFSDEWFDNWKHKRPDQHLFHFNLNSLISFMNTHNFKLVNYSNVEDTIRKNNKDYSNILTAVFEKI